MKTTWAQRHRWLIHLALLSAFCFVTLALPLVMEVVASPQIHFIDFLANLASWRYLASSGLLTAMLALFLESRDRASP